MSKSKFSEDEIREELENILFKIDTEGLAYAVVQGYADSVVLDLSMPKYSKALKDLKNSLAVFEDIIEEFREKYEIDYN